MSFLYEFLKIRTRLTDAAIEDLKNAVDREYERRTKAELNSARVGGGVNH